MTQPLNICPPLKKWCASIAIIFTALVLVGCASNKSTGVTSSGTVDNSSDLTFDASLNDIPPEIRTSANNFSSPIQASDSTGNMGVISQSSVNDSVTAESVETLIVEVMESVNNRPVYRIDYERRSTDGGGIESQFTITSTALPLSNVQHVAPPLRNDINLKLTAIDYDLIGGAGDTTIDGNFYFEIYTNHGEEHNGEEFNNENYLAMGNWLFIPVTRTNTAEYSVGSFVNGADIVEASELSEISGEGSYTGAAYGFALLYNEAGTETEALPLSAEVRLDIDFISDFDITGVINNFNIRSGTASSIASVSGQINLHGSVGNNPGGFFARPLDRSGSTLTFTTSSGETRIHNYESGFWGSNFYGHNAGGLPDRIGGTLSGRSPDSTDDDTEESALQLSFGAYKDSE